MTVTLTFDTALARVGIDVTGLAAADVATVERSTDQVRWTTVRGATAWPVSGGAFVNTLWDNEFEPGVLTYYRVRGIQSGPSTFVAAGTASTGSSGPRTPGLPAGVVAGDAILIAASTRNSGTGTVDALANWTTLASSGNFAVLGRIYDGVWTMPTVTYTAGAASEDTIAQPLAFRNVGLEVVASNTILNASAQNIALPVLTVPQDNCTVVLAGWKQDDWTSAAAIGSGWAEAQEAVSTAGNDAAQVVDYYCQTTAVNVPTTSFVITGGAAAISRAIAIAMPKQAYLNEQTATITPSIDQPWLKSVRRPNLNLAVTPDADTGDPEWGERSALFPIKNRTLPVGVTDLRGGREFDLCVETESLADGETLRLGQMYGDTVYLQVPPGYPELESGYYLVGRLRRANRDKDPNSESFWWYLPMRECAAPTADIIATTVTCADIVADFATCDAVIAAFATCADVLDYVAAPADIIVA